MSPGVSVAAGLGDAFDCRNAARAVGLLREFNAAGVLSAADVHVASRMAGLVGETREDVGLAAALAVRGPRLGHVFVDLASIRDTVSVESEEPVDLTALPWPAPEDWLTELQGSALVAVGEGGGDWARPLRLLGSRLYLDRYWREERRVAADLQALSGERPSEVDLGLLHDGLGRLFPGDSDLLQRAAAASSVLCRLAVVGGGPGTGKTTTVARIIALAAEQAAARGARPPLVALAAPTGKAAARLQEAVHAEAGQLETDPSVRGLLVGLHASTLHRLLGWRPGSHSRFAHDRDNRLPHDLVIVDETSMISLSLMARLVESVRPDARLILVGDPGQLASIEAGVVLGDVVGPASEALRMSADAQAVLSQVIGDELRVVGPGSGAGSVSRVGPGSGAGSVSRAGPGAATIGDGIVVLDRVYRYGAAIARLAEAIRTGDGDGAIAVLRAEHAEITWVAPAAEEPEGLEAGSAGGLEAVRHETLSAGSAVVRAARAGEAGEALRALAGFRLLCAHRHGPFGVSTWTARQQAWLAEEIDDLDLDQRDYVGRPLLITTNDYELGLYNGDTGVIVQSDPGHAAAVFERGSQLMRFSPLRLSGVETVYAMTIHKSQGSQFATAAVLLPPSESPILTRELLYTAVTRAQQRLILVGTEEVVRAAVERPVTRASGLRERLWGA